MIWVAKRNLTRKGVKIEDTSLEALHNGENNLSIYLLHNSITEEVASFIIYPCVFTRSA